MKKILDHSILSSFKEYLDHRVAVKLDAWKNVNTPLFLDSSDDRLSGYRKVGAGPRQWVYDSSISGVNIASPTGFIDSGWQAAKTDFRNARFIVPSNVTGTAPTGAYVTVKHFNSYLSSKDDEELFQNTNFGLAPEMKIQTGVAVADSYHAPCYFVKFANTMNEPFELGGLERTTFNLKVTCFVKSELELIGLASVFRDAKNTNTMVLNDTPLNEFNDLKSRPWSFSQEISDAINSGNYVIEINDSSFNPLKSDNLNSKLKNTYIGLANFTVSVIRSPRQ